MNFRRNVRDGNEFMFQLHHKELTTVANYYYNDRMQAVATQRHFVSPRRSRRERNLVCRICTNSESCVLSTLHVITQDVFLRSIVSLPTMIVAKLY